MVLLLQQKAEVSAQKQKLLRENEMLQQQMNYMSEELQRGEEGSLRLWGELEQVRAQLSARDQRLSDIRDDALRIMEYAEEKGEWRMD